MLSKNIEYLLVRAPGAAGGYSSSLTDQLRLFPLRQILLGNGEVREEMVVMSLLIITCQCKPLRKPPHITVSYRLLLQVTTAAYHRKPPPTTVSHRLPLSATVCHCKLPPLITASHHLPLLATACHCKLPPAITTHNRCLPP